jgi:hypothetical protein
MKRRSDSLLTGLVLLAFVAVTIWLLQRTHREQDPQYSVLTTFSPRPSGALALYELLAQLGYDPQRHRKTEYHYPPDACVVLLDPGGFASALSPLDPTAIRLWLERGGALVLCSEADASEYGLAHSIFEELEATEPQGEERKKVSELGIEATRIGEGGKGRLTPLVRSEGSGDVYKLPAKRPALLQNVGKIEHTDSVPTLVEAALLLRSDAPVLWYRKVGEGELYWLTRPEMASNSWIARADNHRFVLALLDAATRDGRPLYFDEHIHGYLRQAPNLMALLTRTRGGHLLLGLCGLALLLFSGAAVRPAKFTVESVPERRQGVEMVLAQADLYERAGARHVIADSQLDSLRRSYMEQRHLAAPPSEAQLLDWVEREWRGSAERKVLLAEYLRSRLLPRSSYALLDLARACDDAKSMLT